MFVKLELKCSKSCRSLTIMGLTFYYHVLHGFIVHDKIAPIPIIAVADVLVSNFAVLSYKTTRSFIL